MCSESKLEGCLNLASAFEAHEDDLALADGDEGIHVGEHPLPQRGPTRPLGLPCSPPLMEVMLSLHELPPPFKSMLW